MKNIFISLLAMLIIPSALAATDAKTPDTLTVTCPPPSAIKKNLEKLTWSADRNNFRSYDISFAKQVEKFGGAQWNGAEVGQITCVYKMQPKPSFPLLLIYHTLTISPEGGNWTKNLGGYKNCDSTDIKKCAFKVRLKKKTENIYKEAESLKSSNPTFPSE